MHRLHLLISLLCFAIPAFAQPLPELIPFTDGRRWGYADTNGHIRIAPQWAGAALFDGNTAIVLAGDDTSHPGRSIYALIDKQGHYRIPPSRGWNGTYTGWRGPLNAMDTSGRWGMIDTLDNVVIPFEWQPIYQQTGADSLYKVVLRGGLAGVIDRNNRLVVPCRYKYISGIGLLDGIPAFSVTDTLAAPGSNAQGVVRADGKVLVPAIYENVMYGSWPEGRGFHTQRKTGVAKSGQPVYQYAFIPAGGGAPVKQQPAKQQPATYLRRGNYFLYRNDTYGCALLDLKKKVVIPCCKVMDANADTVFLYEVQEAHNLQTISTTFLDAATLKPLGPPRKVTYYQEPIQYGPPAGICGNGVRAWQEGKERERSLPQVNYEGRYTRRFIRDSVLFEVEGYAGDAPVAGRNGLPAGYNADMSVRWPTYSYEPLLKPGEYARVSGRSLSEEQYSSATYSAIADHQARVVVPPLPEGYYINGFNPHDSLVTARNLRDAGALFDTKGTLLAVLKGREPRGAYKLNSRIYTYVVAATEIHNGSNDQYYVTEKIKLADEQGAFIPALSAYLIVGAMHRDGATVALTLTDSMGRMGIYAADGANLYPAINFKYRFLNVSPDGLILAKDSARAAGLLVDADNHDLLGGLRLQAMQEAPSRVPYSGSWRQLDAPDRHIPGLYLATVWKSGTDPNHEQFYIDRHKRIYKAGLMTAAPVPAQKPDTRARKR